MKSIDELLSSLKEHGTIDSEGSFTVSLSEARRKLTNFHSSDKNRYLLLLVSGGTAAHASEIRIFRNEHVLRINFPEAYLPETSLLGAFEGNQNHEYSQAATDFVLGLRGAFDHEWETVVVEIRHPGKLSFRWTMRADDEETEPISGSDGDTGISLSFHGPITFWSKVRSNLLGARGYVGMPPEVRLVDRFCDRSLIPITYNQQHIDRPYLPPEAGICALVGNLPPSFHAPSSSLKIPGTHWQGCLSLTPGEIQIIIHGVAQSHISSSSLSGVVHHTSLQRDLSRQNIVRDSAFSNFLEELDVIEDQLYEHMALGLDEVHDNSVDEHRTEFVVRFLTAKVSSSARKQIRQWLLRSIPRLRPELYANSFPNNSNGLVLCFEALEPRAEPRKMVLQALVSYCSVLLREQNQASQEVCLAMIRVVGKLKGDNSLILGYLHLGLGATQHKEGKKELGDASWFKALQIVWTGFDDKAQELIYLHMELGVEHMLEQVAAAMRMYLSDLQKASF